ncbi:MAG: SDR family NAD(P)-dependent oxidoreductase [Rikenellaceae bacterium]|jgi:NADP-dependent 3-hydroxy acid dehydrogenase YdfG|nr:SDR family NAD(P)-dependent oxidoreductase [Rikenellaceae bacterium]
MDKRIALITGATSGIGEATARAFAAQGWDIIVTGRRAGRLKELKKELEASHDIEVLALLFDIRDRHQIEASLGSLPERFRAVDILVNNAGLAAGLEHIDEGNSVDWEAMIDTNIKGLLYTTRLVSRVMIERGRGHIVNIGSIAGRQVYENGAVYCASKHAVNALSQGMRIDLVRHGIRVTEVRPGMVETEFSEVRFHGDTGRAAAVYEGVEPLSAEDIAEAVLWALTRPAHVNIDEIALTPQQQANAYYTYRK